MSVIIVGIEMPKNCFDCPCCNGENGYCQLRKEYVYGEVPRSCPLVPVPDHGRLGDLDAFESIKYELPDGQKAFNRGFHSGVQYVQRLVMDAPTIIPAEEDGI